MGWRNHCPIGEEPPHQCLHDSPGDAKEPERAATRGGLVADTESGDAFRYSARFGHLGSRSATAYRTHRRAVRRGPLPWARFVHDDIQTGTHALLRSCLPGDEALASEPNPSPARGDV